MRKLVLLSAVLVSIVIAAACGGGGGGSSSLPSESPYLASESIGPEGGTVEVTDSDSPYYGASAHFPAGALTAEIQITLEAVPSQSDDEDSIFAPDSLPIRLNPEGLEFNVPVRVTVPYSESFLNTWNITDEANLAIFSFNAETGEWLGLYKDWQDENRNLTSAEAPYSSIFGNMSPEIWELYHLPEGFIDPEVPRGYSYHLDLGLYAQSTPSSLIPVESWSFGGSPRTFNLGKGSLQDLSDPDKKNLILVHGIFASPFTFQFSFPLSSDPYLPTGQPTLNENDLINSLWGDYDNIILFRYDYTRRMDTAYSEDGEIIDSGTGNRLAVEFDRYNIPTSYGPGDAGCTDIVAHSMGGLVARVAIEQQGVTGVRNLVTIGTPHLGVENRFLEGVAYVSSWVVSLPGPQQLFTDSSMGVEFFANLNGGDRYSWGNWTRYFLIAGDIGDGSDGRVAVDSAIGAYDRFRFWDSDWQNVFTGSQYGHGALHEDARNNGVANQIRTWINTSAIGLEPPQFTVETTTGNNPLPFSVSIWNSGGGVLEWFLEVIIIDQDSPDFAEFTGFNFSPNNGSIVRGEVDLMSVSIDTAVTWHPAGTYQYILVIGSTGTFSQRSVQITIIISD